MNINVIPKGPHGMNHCGRAWKATVPTARSGVYKLFIYMLILCLLTCVETEKAVTPPVIYCHDETIVSTSGSRQALSHLRYLITEKNKFRNGCEITIDYPFNNTLFPLEIVAPTVLWHDTSNAASWIVEVRFHSGSQTLFTLVDGKRPEPSPPDSICLRKSNQWKENDYQKSACGWQPDDTLWTFIKKNAVAGSTQIDIYGCIEESKTNGSIVSHGSLTIRTSSDPVGAPIFYRDVPLMPAKNSDGVIQPLLPSAIPLISWRLRDIAKPSAPVVMKRMPTCINCHSFSVDGKTMGMDMDGPRGDKGAYTIIPIAKKAVITREDVFSWNDFNLEKNTFGMFSQVSPDGKYIVTSVEEEVHVVNYMDFRFLQTFYPTRGKLAYYDRRADTIRILPGADDPHFVHCNPVWSPDGKWIAFLKAPARNAFGNGPKATSANDPRETQIKYDLYRIPFNNGKGGDAEPVVGASGTGRSVSFPKYSPDGRWIVFVQAANGLLMRPDSRLYIIPSEGGEARELTCNLPLMNSWHSWSPNSKWMVFSSKAFTPFTQMFLTHIDDDGNASPAVLIPNSTASNRAVNIPEFVNIPQHGIASIRIPAADYKIHFDLAEHHFNSGKLDDAYKEIGKAIELRPDYAQNYSLQALILAKQERLDDAMKASLKAIEKAPTNNWVHLDAGIFLYAAKRIPEAIEHLALAVRYNPESVRTHYFYGLALGAAGKPQKAFVQYNEALRCDPVHADAYNNRGLIHFKANRTERAIEDCSRAIEIEPKATYFHNRAVAYLSLNDTSRALRDLDSAVLLDPTDGTIWYMRGTLLQQRKATETALMSFDRALAANPCCIEALDPFCSILFAQNRHATVIRRLSEVIDRRPENIQLYNWRGIARMYLGQFDSALADFDLVIEKKPEEPGTYYYKALCFEAQGLRDAAAHSYRLSLEYGSPKNEQYAKAMQRLNELK